jgi:glycosyltransferase involved in cell wall biosynthesis
MTVVEPAPAAVSTSPAVSVILIFYNTERFLADAIESVISQTFDDWELILVDDGSSDGSEAISRRYAEGVPGKIFYTEHEGHANRGMSASRNRGADIARGKFLAFIDSDDLWAPGKLNEQLEVLADYPDAALVCGALFYWYSWNGTEEIGVDRAILTAGIGDRLVSPPEVALLAYPLGNRTGAGIDFLVRRAAFDAVEGFEDSFRGMYEDQCFLLKIFARYPVYLSSKVWYIYRQHRNSCSEDSFRNNTYELTRQKFFDWAQNYILANNLDDRLQKALVKARRPRSPAMLLLRRLGRGLLRRLIPRGDGPLGRFHA